MKTVTTLLIMLLSSSALADFVDPDGFIRNDDGRVKLFSFEKALKACPTGMHLPTALEVALKAKSLGASLVIGQIAPNSPEDYFEVRALNPDGTMDIFFYKADKYDSSQDNIRLDSFWTASMLNWPNSDNWVYTFDEGNFSTLTLSYINAVKCVADK